MRPVFAAAFASAALALAAAPARAGVVVGDLAPDMEGEEFFNGPKFTLKSLRGKVILYDIFRTW